MYVCMFWWCRRMYTSVYKWESDKASNAATRHERDVWSRLNTSPPYWTPCRWIRFWPSAWWKLLPGNIYLPFSYMFTFFIPQFHMMSWWVLVFYRFVRVKIFDIKNFIKPHHVIQILIYNKLLVNWLLIKFFLHFVQVPKPT